ASWLVILMILRPSGQILKQVFTRTFKQMWGALLVAFFIFALAYIFVYTGMANSLAYGLSKIGVFFVVLAPILGWIGVALSGSNTSTNAMFGPVQAATGRLLNLPVLLLPTLNSVGAEVGKPIAPQTASVGVSRHDSGPRASSIQKGSMGLVGLGRLELPTSPLSGVRSSHLSYRPNVLADNILRDWLRSSNNAKCPFSVRSGPKISEHRRNSDA